VIWERGILGSKHADGILASSTRVLICLLLPFSNGASRGQIVSGEEEAAGQPWGGVPVVTARRLFPTDTFDLDRESADFHPTIKELVGAAALGKPSTGTELLMMAILEDALRCYLGPPGRLHNEAECWVLGTEAWMPFSFPVVCEVLGFSPDALRLALRHWQSRRGACRRIPRRLRPNVRSPADRLRPLRALPIRNDVQKRRRCPGP